MTNDEKLKAWRDNKRILYSAAKKTRTPISGTFELTPQCNLHCKMCYVRLSPAQAREIGDELTAAQWIELGRQAAAAGTLELLLTGGEIFLKKDFPEIYRELSQMGFRIILFTNATLLDDKLLAMLAELPPSEIGITLYGASAETYEKVCGEGKWFEKALNNVRLLATTLKNTPITLRGTFINDNLADLAELKAIAKELGLPFRISHALLKGIRGAHSDVVNCRLSLEQIVDLNREHLEYYDEEDYAIPENYTGALTCNAALVEYAVSWDGKMLPCLSFSSPYTYPVKHGFDAAWDELGELRKEISVPERCHDCELRPYCGWCPAAVQSESGSFYESPAECIKYRVLATD